MTRSLPAGPGWYRDGVWNRSTWGPRWMRASYYGGGGGGGGPGVSGVHGGGGRGYGEQQQDQGDSSSSSNPQRSWGWNYQGWWANRAGRSWNYSGS